MSAASERAAHIATEHRETIARTLENVEGMAFDALVAGICSMGVDALTVGERQQLEILRLLVDGRSAKEIARLLDISRSGFYAWKKRPKRAVSAFFALT